MMEAIARTQAPGRAEVLFRLLAGSSRTHVWFCWLVWSGSWRWMAFAASEWEEFADAKSTVAGNAGGRKDWDTDN